MLHLKRIDKYVLTNFLTLFFATFFICSFILIMQFLWMNIGEMVGKGLPFGVLMEFFFYAWLSLVPLALPLAILLASLMAFGNMGENLELLAMKSAGVSLFRIMRSLMVFIIFICIGAFVFSNNVIPISQKKMWSLMFSIRQKSPELNIPVGQFYSGIDNMRLYVRSKNHKTGALNDVMMYDFSKGFNNASITTADTVYVKMTDDKLFLKITFINGEGFENINNNESGFKSKNVPYRRESFARREILIDFDANFNEMDESLLNNQHVAKDIVRLSNDIDSINDIRDSIKAAYTYTLLNEKYFANAYTPDSLEVDLHKRGNMPSLTPEDEVLDVDTIFKNAPYRSAKTIASSMKARISSLLNDAQYNAIIIQDNESYYNRHAIELHRKFTLSFACLIFFFIGAPLGAIIRKGGLGMPVVVSVLMFIVYYIIDTMGVKFARESVIDVWQGMWLSSFVLLPIGIFLTYKAATDSALFNKDGYKLFFNRVKVMILSRIKGINLFRHSKKTDNN